MPCTEKPDCTSVGPPRSLVWRRPWLALGTPSPPSMGAMLLPRLQRLLPRRPVPRRIMLPRRQPGSERSTSMRPRHRSICPMGQWWTCPWWIDSMLPRLCLARTAATPSAGRRLPRSCGRSSTMLSPPARMLPMPMRAVMMTVMTIWAASAHRVSDASRPRTQLTRIAVGVNPTHALSVAPFPIYRDRSENLRRPRSPPWYATPPSNVTVTSRPSCWAMLFCPVVGRASVPMMPPFPIVFAMR
mmetsp:Transcript_21269/g.61023  ORF Transcript_21269/g.61023 Transcript_21269/m.61023 type:complete len:243 (-) Transcript_21269:2714-3442(-)